MAQERTALRAPPAIQRRPAVSNGVQRSAAESPRSPARALQERFGNRVSQILVSRSIASQTRETSEGHDTVLPPIQRAEQSPKSVRLPAKVSKANDPAELEAEETARKVMRMNQPSAPKPTASPTPTQKGIATGTVQRAEASPSPATAPPSSASRVSIPGGSPLPPAVRSHMEPRFGANFGNVRVHTGDSAAQQSTSLNARAFTVGDHIFFGKEKYQPQSPSGRELIAHELTHTIQQGAAVQRSVDTLATQSDQPQVQRKAAGPNSAPRNDAASQQTVSSQVVDISTGVFDPSEKVKGEIQAQRKGLMVRVVAKGLTGEGQVKTRADGSDKYYSMASGSLPLLNPWVQQFGGMYLNFTVKNNQVAGYASLKPGGGNPNDWLEAVQKNSSLLGGVGLKVDKLPKLVNKFEHGKLTLGMTDLGVNVGGFLDAKFNVLVENTNQPQIHATAIIKIKGMEDGTLTLDNIDGKLTGQISLAVNFKGFSGSAMVKYLADGTVDVSGKAGYNADKLSGEIEFVATDLETANKFAKDSIAAAGGKENVQNAPPPAPVPLPKAGKKSRALAATGLLKFNLTQWFAGTVNVIVDGKGDVTVIGKIAPPGEILLFPQKSWDKELIKFEAKAYYGIPVVGNLNLFANISLHALADLGPAKIHKIEVLGTYSTDPEIQKKIEISGSINISAYAGLRLRAEGGAGIEILSHDLKFGIGLNADVGVKAYAEARPTIGYRDPGQFYISGTLEMVAQPMLGLGGEFFIELETPWWSPLSDDKWTWPLFSKEWPLTDPIGINATLKEYVLGSGNIPEIELKKPEFDPSKFMTSMVDRKLPDKSGGPGAGSGTFKDDGSVAKPTVTPKKPATKTDVKLGKKGTALTGGKSANPDQKAQTDQVATKALKGGLDGLKNKEPYSKPELDQALGALKVTMKGVSFTAKAAGDKWIVTSIGGAKKKSAGQIQLAMKKDGATADGAKGKKEDEGHFTDAEGKSHDVYVEASGNTHRLMVASTPMGARAFLDQYIKTGNAEYRKKNENKIKAVTAAIEAAEKQSDKIDKAKAGGKTDAQLVSMHRELLNLNVTLGKALSAILNTDEDFATAKEKYLLEGLSGTYGSTPKPKGDQFTADHQPQAAILQVAAKFRFFTRTGEMAERAADRAAAGFAINLFFSRHTAGRTYGKKGSITKADFINDVKSKVDKTEPPEKQRKAVIKVIKDELKADVKAIKSVVTHKEHFQDIIDLNLRPKAKEEKMIQEIKDRIVAGEDQVAAQDLDSLAD